MEIFKKGFRLALLICLSFAAYGQEQVQQENKDLIDVISGWRGGEPKPRSAEIVLRKNYISILPVVGYAPANGFVLGAAVSLSRLFDPKPTNLSSGMLNVQVTSKKQFIINARSKIYLQNNKWFLQGDWRILFFNQPTYGLGVNNGEPGSNPFLININGLNTENNPQAQDMRYNYVRVYEDVVRHIGQKSWYVGVGIALDYHYSIKDQRLQTDSAQPNFFISDHYAYSVAKGFNSTEYTTAGFNLNVLTDKRDNIANPYKGYYASLSYRVNPKIFRSSQVSTMVSYDARYYWGLSRKAPRHLIAFWSWGTFVARGNVPYLALPSIGWDTYNRSGRGYIQGRYRGLSMVYNEVEYRFPISRNGLFGGVVFISGTCAESATQNLLDKITPAGGFGIRLKMDKAARVNLTADIGYGADNSGGIYLGLQEAF